jgi:hypothetical protein
MTSADGLVYVSLAQLMALAFKARDLSFLARQPQGSILAGNHASRLRGRGLNFDELRCYQPGDDLRHLIGGRRCALETGGSHLHRRTRRPALILVDQRMSMSSAPSAVSNPSLPPNLARWPRMVFNAEIGLAAWFQRFTHRRTPPLRSRKRSKRQQSHAEQISAERGQPTPKARTNSTRFYSTAWR